MIFNMEQNTYLKEQWIYLLQFWHIVDITHIYINCDIHHAD